MKNAGKCLIIFDDQVDIHQAQEFLKTLNHDEIDCFPLTSNWDVIARLTQIGDIPVCVGGAKINILPSAQLVHHEELKIGQILNEWITQIGQTRALGKTLCKWFKFKKSSKASSWWFTKLSDKNNLGMELFLRMAQAKAIENCLKEEGYDNCYIMISDKYLIKTVGQMNCSNGSRVEILPLQNQNAKEKLLSWPNILKHLDFFNEINEGLKLFAINWKRSGLSRRIMGASSGGRARENPVLIVTFFPNLDKDAAKHGKFVCNYFSQLQKKLENDGREIVWIAMYHPSGDPQGASYEMALVTGSRFGKDNTSIYFNEEYLFWVDYLALFLQWTKQILKYMAVNIFAPGDFLTNSYFDKKYLALIKPVWRESVIGPTGIDGLTKYRVFKNVMAKHSTATHLIYLCELHAWEKALNSAKMDSLSTIKTVGFQHAIIAKHLYGYKLNRTDLSPDENGQHLPMPDIMACNGEIPLEKMKQMGVDNTVLVEAIRHSHMAGEKSVKPWIERKNIVAVMGSYSRKETVALVSMIKYSLQGQHDYEIWFKGHPWTSIEDILRDQDMRSKADNYVIKTEPIHNWIGNAKVVVVGQSSVAIEALGFGVSAIIPVMVDIDHINPLAGYDDMYTTVSTPSQLREAIDLLLANTSAVTSVDEVRELIKQMWCLDNSLSRWERMLR